MLFNSFEFVALLLVTFLLYYLPFLSKYQIEILIIASLLFYSYNQPLLVFLLLASATINIITSYLIVYGHSKHKKSLAILGVIINLSILVFFKYSPLFSRTFFAPTDSVGQFLLTVPLPIGISFFTFQGISLVIDVFHGKYHNNEDIIPISFGEHAKRILFFKAFFPQLISGPIVKAHDFIPQIGVKKLKDIHWERCFKNLVLGYFLKMVVADNLKDFTYWITYPYFETQSTVNLLAMLFGYSCQIFADFAGYSLIALGLARLFGYELPVNFNFPYLSTSFSEFWTRWHISLSSFLREYLYIPLGGNRKGPIRTYINLMLTMVLGGLWHGAAWSYAVWGGFHGGLLVTERFLKSKLTIQPGLVVQFLKGLGVFSLVTLGWLLFKLPVFSHVIDYFQTLYENRGVSPHIQDLLYLAIYCSPVILYHMAFLMTRNPNYVNIKKQEYMIYGFMLFLIITNSGSSGEFIYFQF